MASVEGRSEQATDAGAAAPPARLPELRRAAPLVALALAPGAVLYLAFNQGGYHPSSWSFAAVVFALALALRVLLSERPFEGFNRPVAVVLASMALYGLLQLASSLWSHATVLALDEYVRTLLYLLAFALLASFPRSWQRLEWLVRGLALALAAVCVAALTTRVLPHLWPTGAQYQTPRLSYPLGYWNALGLVAVMALVLLVHLGSELREHPLLRVLAAALVPAVATALLLTYSRGAIGVAIVGLLAYSLLGRPRGLASMLLAVLAPVALALRSAYDAVALSGEHPSSPAAVPQGHHVAVTVALCMLAAAALRALAVRVLDPRLEQLAPELAPLRRLPRWARVGVPVAALLVVLLAVGAPGLLARESERFIDVNHAPTAARERERLTEATSNGRAELWRLAGRQFLAHPLVGQGASTYQFYFAEHRKETTITDYADNLYLQTLGEQGLVGLALLLVALVTILVTLASRCRGSRRAWWTALFTVALVWAIHAGVDYDWQMPAVTLVLWVIGGAAMASPRQAVGAAADARPPVGAAADARRRTVRMRDRALCAGGLVALAVAPAITGASFARLQSAGAALAQRRYDSAHSLAQSSISVLAERPEAYEIVGYSDIYLGHRAASLAQMRKAISLEPESWDAHYALAVARAANGLEPLPEMRRALRLDPGERILHVAWRDFRAAAAGSLPAVASEVLTEGLESEDLGVSML